MPAERRRRRRPGGGWSEDGKRLEVAAVRGWARRCPRGGGGRGGRITGARRRRQPADGTWNGSRRRPAITIRMYSRGRGRRGKCCLLKTPKKRGSHDDWSENGWRPQPPLPATSAARRRPRHTQNRTHGGHHGRNPQAPVQYTVCTVQQRPARGGRTPDRRQASAARAAKPCSHQPHRQAQPHNVQQRGQ